MQPITPKQHFMWGWFQPSIYVTVLFDQIEILTDCYEEWLPTNLSLVSLLMIRIQRLGKYVRDRILALGTDIIPFLREKWRHVSTDIQTEIEECPWSPIFAFLKLRLSDWKSSEDRDLLTGFWIINTYRLPSIEFDTAQCRNSNQFTLKSGLRFPNILQPLLIRSEF